MILTQIFKSANLAIVLANWVHLFIFNQKDNSREGYKITFAPVIFASLDSYLTTPTVLQ